MTKKIVLLKKRHSSVYEKLGYEVISEPTAVNSYYASLSDNQENLSNKEIKPISEKKSDDGKKGKK